MPDRMPLAQWGVLLLTAALFGSSFFFIKLTVDAIPPFTLAAARAALAAGVMALALRALGGRLPRHGRGWAPLLLLGLLTAAIPYAAIAYGQKHIDSSLGGVLFAAIPVFSVIVAPLFLAEERLTAPRLGAALIGLAGVALAVGPEALLEIGDQAFGAAATLLAALSYATGAIYARQQKHLTPLDIAAGQLLTGAAMLAPLSLAIDAPWRLSPDGAALLSLAAVALLNTAAPVLLLFWLVRKAGATNASLTAFFMPVAAVLLGVLILGERLSWTALAGLALITIAAAIVTGDLRLAPRPSRAERP